MKKKIDDFRWVAMIATVVSGIVIHLFGLMNVLQNYDNISTQPAGYGTGIQSGRWFLTILGDWDKEFMGAYNLPWVNGIIGILLLAVATYFLIDIFAIKDRKFAILLGIGCAAFPSVASCMLFKYTIQYYALAILMAVVAAYAVIKAPKRFMVLASILSAVLTACSLGIYQAYLPLTAGIFVLYLIQQSVLNQRSWKEIFIHGLYYVLSLVLGLIFYFLALQASLKYYDVTLVGYQGIDKMGQLSLTELPQLFIAAFTGYFTMPEENTYMLASVPMLAIIYQAWNVAAAVMIVISLVQRKAKLSQWGITAVLCICFPIAVNLLVVMCANSWVYTLMVHAFVLLLFVPVVFFEALPEAKGKWVKPQQLCAGIIAVSLGLASFAYSYTANVTYTAEYYANRQAENLANSMVTQVRMTEGFRPDQKWVLLGRYSDPMMSYAWDNAPAYEGIASPSRLVNSYSWSSWIRHYVGYSVQWVDDQTREQLLAKEVVQEMPSWPEYGSIQIIDDTVVIKLSD